MAENGSTEVELREEMEAKMGALRVQPQTLQRLDSQASGILSPSGSSPSGTSQGRAGRKHRTEPFLIGVAGGTASGKTTVCDQIMQRLHGGAKYIELLKLQKIIDVYVLDVLDVLNVLNSQILCADQCVVMLAQDSFYRVLNSEEKADVKSECPTIK